jgi:hypothetical protein
MKLVAEKMGIKEGMRAILINVPKEGMDVIGFPDIDIADKLTDDFDYIHLFVKNQAELKEKFPVLKANLKPNGMLWISWPKNRQLETDLNIKNIINLGYSFGLVESTCLSINSIWSGIKFTYPKKGKVYNNSYGQLKL